MTTPLSAPVTYQQALAMATESIAAQKLPTPATDRAVAITAVTADSIAAARDRASAHAKAAIGTLWASVTPYNEQQVTDFAAQAARIMLAAQAAAARAAAVGQSQQLLALGIKTPATQTVQADVRAPSAVIRAGRLVLQRAASTVDYEGSDAAAKVSMQAMGTLGIFKRPAAVFRYAASTGSKDPAAQAVQRIGSLVDDNLMLAQRLAQQQILVQAVVDLDTGRTRSGPKIIGYRRIIHPELSRGGTCGMCIVAADRIYHVAELMPIHANCHCGTAAVTEDYDPADDLNAVDLGQLYKDAGGTSGAHLKRTRYKVDQHGELGPVLVPAAKYKPRTTKSKVRVGGTALQSDQPAQADVAKHQIGVLEANLAKMRDEGVSEDSPKIAYHNQLIAKLRDQVANVSFRRSGG